MKTKFLKKYGVLVLVFVMLSTTAVSLVLWATGVLGGNNSGGGTIDISEGRHAATTVDIGDAVVSQGSLVPLTVTPITGETQTITLEFSVKWIASDDPAGAVEGIVSTLTVECVSILAGESELAGEKIAGDAPLFLINLGGTDGSYDITGNAGSSGQNITTVTVSIQLNEPKDAEQYSKIAGGSILLTFSFTVADIDF